MTAIPSGQVQRDGRLGAGLGGEINEIADLLEQRGEVFGRSPPGYGPQLLYACQLPFPLIEERPHIHDRQGLDHGGRRDRGSRFLEDRSERCCFDAEGSGRQA